MHSTLPLPHRQHVLANVEDILTYLVGHKYILITHYSNSHSLKHLSEIPNFPLSQTFLMGASYFISLRPSSLFLTATLVLISSRP